MLRWPRCFCARIVFGVADCSLSVVVVIIIIEIRKWVANVFELDLRRFIAKLEKMYMDRPDKLRKSYLLEPIMDEGTYGFFQRSAIWSSRKRLPVDVN